MTRQKGSCGKLSNQNSTGSLHYHILSQATFNILGILMCLWMASSLFFVCKFGFTYPLPGDELQLIKIVESDNIFPADRTKFSDFQI